MSADLAQARIEAGDVLRVERLGTLIELTVALPHLAATAKPGQFAQLRCGDGVSPLLRRPFSVAWIDEEECSFVFEVVGQGTRLLASLEPGDTLDVLGPLGTGFTLEPSRAPMVVSGGVGCAPFPLLIRALLDAGAGEVHVLSGAATLSRLYPASRFKRGRDVRVREITDDGSSSARGRVTDLVRGELDDDARTVYACGPNAMLGALWDAAGEHASRGAVLEASLEAPMGCGFGTCLGCALPVHTDGRQSRWALCCSDGPVFRMDTVDWDALRELPGADVA